VERFGPALGLVHWNTDQVFGHVPGTATRAIAQHLDCVENVGVYGDFESGPAKVAGKLADRAVV